MILSDVTCSVGFKKKIKEIEDRYKNISSKSGERTGGFIDRSMEKKFKAAMDYWEKYIVGNKNNNPVITSLMNIMEKTKCDITKCDSRILTPIKMDYEIIKDIVTRTKDMDLKNNSYFSEFVNMYEFMFKKENIKLFTKAYDIYDKNRKKGSSSLFTVFTIVMIWTLILYTLIFVSAIMSLSTLYSVRKQYGSYDNIIDTELIKIVDDEQKSNKAFINNIMYTTMEVVHYLKSIKNLNSEFDKAVKHDMDVNNEYSKRIKSSESIDEKYMFFGEKSRESFLVDKTYDKRISTEEIGVVLLVLVGSIVGFVLLINLIRRAIYQMAAIKVNIIEILVTESETLRVNIEMLRERAERSKNPEEVKRLQKIIEKQEKSFEKMKKTIDKAKIESADTVYEADDYVEEENRRIDSGEDETTSDSDDYDVIL